MTTHFIDSHYNKKTKKSTLVYELSQHLSIFVPEQMGTNHFIFRIITCLVVVLFALQPEDYNAFSENEPPFLGIEQSGQYFPADFNDEAIMSRSLSLNRARQLCAETTTTYNFSTENTNLYIYSEGNQPHNLRSLSSPERSLLCIYRL